MSLAVEGAAVVLICMSQKYKDSPSCRSGVYVCRSSVCGCVDLCHRNTRTVQAVDQVCMCVDLSQKYKDNPSCRSGVYVCRSMSQ